ncbi:MAG: PAS domain S-box protein [Deltaproteobacteria bacterium]|nr:PAS domain S-box protein [Deltaproteobacteria bacterium]MBW1943518.1 PAS domain S-box protein [Deltaproteobacteria bacterium]
MSDKPSYEKLALRVRELEKDVREHQNVEKHFKELFESANDLIQSVDSEGRLLYVNKKWRETLGYKKNEVQKLCMWDIIHPEFLAHCKAVFNKVFSGEVMDNIETVFLSKQGNSIPVEGNASCRFIGGKPQATIGIFRDKRKRKQAEEALRQAHEEIKDANRKLGLAYAQMRDWKDQLSAQLSEAEIGFLVDQDGRILGTTEAALEFSGLSRIHMLKKSIFDLVEAGDREGLLEDIHRAWAGISGRRSIGFISASNNIQQCETKIMQVNLKDGKMLLFLLRESS